MSEFKIPVAATPPTQPATPPDRTRETRGIRCPNEPRCTHPAFVHDVDTYEEDPRPICCADGCRCGKPSGGAQ